MGKEYGKGKHGIGFKIGIASAVGIVVIILAALAGFPFSSDTGVDSGGPSGGLFAGATVAPSDEDGGIVYGDGFTVTTIGTGYSSEKEPNLFDIPARIENVKFEKISEREEDGAIKIKVTYRLVPEKTRYDRAIGVLYIGFSPDNVKFSNSGSFTVFPENKYNEGKTEPYGRKTIYFQIKSYAHHNGVAFTPVYKVTHA